MNPNLFDYLSQWSVEELASDYASFNRRRLRSASAYHSKTLHSGEHSMWTTTTTTIVNTSFYGPSFKVHPYHPLQMGPHHNKSYDRHSDRQIFAG